MKPAQPENEYHQLAFYTLSLGDAGFIHQHIVDAYTAQTADGNTKAISLVFALAGLYLYLEKGYTGRQVQHFHLKMAENKKNWPLIALPRERGAVTVTDVLCAAPGSGREQKIRQWCQAVWQLYQDSRTAIISLVESYL